MAEERLHDLLRRLRRLSGEPEGGLSDAQLLEHFVSRRDEAAFEVLVWRHGPMVLGVCRRLLRHEQDAEDAFQATFLTLVRRAGSIGNRQAVAAWLYRVAYRVALAARAAAEKRAAREQPAVEPAAPADKDDLLWRDLRPVLDEEVNRLPERFRTPFVLCYLEGKTNEEAARQLGCPKGTVLSRLARARERLRVRLLRRGVCLSAALFATAGLEQALATTVPAALVAATVRVALAVAAGKAIAAVASAQVAALTEGVLRAMLLTKLKTTLVVLLVLGLVAGAGLLGRGLPRAGADPEQAEKKDEPGAEAGPTPAAEKKEEAEDPLKLAARRSRSQNNLKQIGVALHSYQDVYGHFPAPAIYDPRTGKPLLSWRVAILPYIEQDNLYRQFHLDEPWDGPHNKKLLAALPSTYAPVGADYKETDRTYYQAIVGTGAAWEPGQKKAGPPGMGPMGPGPGAGGGAAGMPGRGQPRTEEQEAPGAGGGAPGGGPLPAAGSARPGGFTGGPPGGRPAGPGGTAPASPGVSLGLPLMAFTDGTSNTILVVEAARPVPWTKPEDLPYVPDQALPRFGGLFHGDFNALFADGSVHFLSRNADDEALRAAITRDAGDVVDFSKLRALPGGRYGDGKVEPEQVSRENARLKELVQATTNEAKKTREELELLKLRLAHGRTVDAKTARLLQENAELEQQLEKALEELETLKAQKAELEKEMKKRLPEKK
jgi:RNA polymerase sigma factor (sigma-70 family)